ncbi:hypothetical protein ZIOFF_074516 (mitochondrion) [Zingiber officinale]|uniref:Uncharacterized protein n=1 Tax=Zingiber officinale TaxID=94328 RepID=A0A8J5BWQ4_ZINOF|nr:hypothetical protein ZIOFF_074800 [Zingiber officinale]KAG6467633.1 hypothetical protein ZIOFF_074516 [Zingiber officinale]
MERTSLYKFTLKAEVDPLGKEKEEAQAAQERKEAAAAVHGPPTRSISGIPRVRVKPGHKSLIVQKVGCHALRPCPLRLSLLVSVLLLLIPEVIEARGIDVRGQGWLYFWERTPGEYEAHGYKLCLGMKDNSESALSTNKEAISNATMNLMESSILAQDERWRHA